MPSDDAIDLVRETAAALIYQFARRDRRTHGPPVIRQDILLDDHLRNNIGLNYHIDALQEGEPESIIVDVFGHEILSPAFNGVDVVFGMIIEEDQLFLL